MYKNYKILKEKDLSDINSHGTLLNHIKSGAKVLLLKNDDENKSFCIGFRTPPYDDTGLPHILEHSVLCGSRKFPVKEPFVELMKSSLNTFLNAMTFPDKTIYPVASCNHQDFKNLMDIYMDAVLYPNMQVKEEIFKQEGWHYELDSLDGEITYNGVVYNEMKGAFSSPDGILERESLNALFPDTPYGVESGGNPDFIPTLSYEMFKEFHKKYYHPSNSYIIVYGNSDMEEVLNWLDSEYLSHFDKTDIDSNISVQKPFEKKLVKEVVYPINAEQGTNNKTLMSYNIALPAKTKTVDLMAMDVISDVLINAAGAPLVRAILDSGVAEVVSGSFESGILQPVLNIVAKNTNPEQKEKFESVIESELNKYVNEGLDKKALLAAINSYEFKLREADFGGTSKGIIYSINALGTWLYDENDPFSFFEYSTIFDYLKEQVNTNYFEELIKKYLINNTHKTIVIAKPSTTYQEEHDSLLREKLAKYKESLSNEELVNLIEQTKALKAYQGAPDKEEDLATIPLLSKEDLSYDVLPLLNKEENVCNIKLMHHNYPTNKIAYIRYLFNIKNIPAKYVPYLGIFKTLFRSLDTKNHTYQSLEQDININTGGISSDVISFNTKSGYDVYFQIKVNVLEENIKFAHEILSEIISSTNFNMKSRIKECLAMSNSYMQQSLIGAGHAKSFQRSLSYVDPTSYYNDLTSGIGYFEVLTDLIKEYDNKFDELVLVLNDLNSKIFTKENAIISYTGSAFGFNAFKEELASFSEVLYENYTDENPFVFVPNQKNEGFKAPIDVQYVALTGNFVKENLPYTGALHVFQKIISTDYLWTKVRVLGGAYGCMCGFGRSGSSYFVSYRDPNLTNTLEVYKNVVNYIDEFNPSDVEMLKYIIGAVGNFDYPKSASNKGNFALTSYLQGLTEEDYKREKKELIDATKEDIKKIKAYIEAIINQNNLCVIGNLQKIEENKELFKETKMLFK